MLQKKNWAKQSQSAYFANEAHMHRKYYRDIWCMSFSDKNPIRTMIVRKNHFYQALLNKLWTLVWVPECVSSAVKTAVIFRVYVLFYLIDSISVSWSLGMVIYSTHQSLWELQRMIRLAGWGRSWNFKLTAAQSWHPLCSIYSA